MITRPLSQFRAIRPFWAIGLVGLAAAATLACHGSRAAPLPLRTLADIPLGQATLRYDYASLDANTGRLFIADLAGSRVLVVDIRAGRLAKAIPGLPRVHGVLAVPQNGRVYASATGEDQVSAIDEGSLSVVSHVAGGHYPDGMAWMPGLNKLYVSDEHGNSVSVIDLAANTVVKTIPIGGEVGNTQFDPADGLIYTNDQTHDQLVAIDPATDTETKRWRLVGCEENHGLLIDPSRQIAYIACQKNAKLATFSLRGHRILALDTLGADPDVLAGDFGLGRLYVAGESGIVSVFDIAAAAPRKLGEARLADNAHIVAIDPATHRVYFPLRNLLGHPVLRVMRPTAPAR